MEKKEYVKFWSHTLNENDKVELRLLVGDKVVFLELEDKDIRSMGDWIVLRPLLRTGKIGRNSSICTE